MNSEKIFTQKIEVRDQKFLPMSITPNFDEIPQVMKDLRRWLCWQLQPKPDRPKPSKVPMTPKYDKLKKADVTNPENWLTVDEAISWYQRGLCSGIGFALTDALPKVCCIDVDHCFNPDGTLTDEAQAVIDACPNCYVEISQSGTGIHIWFIDEEFKGGRRGDVVEVYAADRYIAVTGVRVQSSANDLPTVNGLCSKVIAEFIGVREENLFDMQPARATQEQHTEGGDCVKLEDPLTDDDRRLIKYFKSDECARRDPNMLDLFSGNLKSYFDRINETQDDSVADNHLLLKLLYYVGGSGTDADIARRALRLFNQSALATRDKWQSRADYRERTLNAAFAQWVSRGRKARHDDDRLARDDDLPNALRDALALAKQGKHGTNKPAKVVSLFDSSTNETVEANDYREDDLKELRKTLSKLAQEVESKISELLKSTSGDSDASNAL